MVIGRIHKGWDFMFYLRFKARNHKEQTQQQKLNPVYLQQKFSTFDTTESIKSNLFLFLYLSLFYSFVLCKSITDTSQSITDTTKENLYKKYIYYNALGTFGTIV